MTSGVFFSSETERARIEETQIDYPSLTPVPPSSLCVPIKLGGKERSASTQDAKTKDKDNPSEYRCRDSRLKVCANIIVKDDNEVDGEGLTRL